MLLARRIDGRGHAADDLPRALRSNPGVRDPQFVASNLSAIAIRPRCIDSIVISCDVARNLNRELLDRVGLEGNSFGRVGRDPVGNVILSHRHGTDEWPPDKIRVPERAILLEVVGFHVIPVGFFQMPDLRFVLRCILSENGRA